MNSGYPHTQRYRDGSYNSVREFTTDFSVLRTVLERTTVKDPLFYPSVGPLRITNEDFIAEVFRDHPANSYPLICTKSADPTIGPWLPHLASEAKRLTSDRNNNYVNCSSFVPEADGKAYARKANFSHCNFLMLDDIGTKVSMDRLQNFELSWLIQTSPGNHQGGILLDKSCSNLEDATALLDALIAAGLSDPDARSPATRWARLPVGINGKPAYRELDGKPFQCKLVTWSPTKRFTRHEVMQMLGLQENNQKRISISFPIDSSADSSDSIKKLTALLEKLDPDCSYEYWFRAIAAVFHETHGSEDGFHIVNQWSRKGSKYTNEQGLRLKWRSFKTNVQNPITIRSLMKMVSETNQSRTENAIANSDTFALCETITIEAPSKSRVQDLSHPLGKFAVSHNVHDLEKNMVEQKPLLGNLALMGQATVFYAKHNTGKTLIALHLIIEAIELKRVDPSKIFYINMDDNSSGLLEKARMAQEYGFHMIADGHADFQVGKFRLAMHEMIESSKATGVVIILDTLKKFVNTMDKTQSSSFANLIRKFCLKGGTVIALAHVNKNVGSDGKAVPSGTSDILDDFDCGYVLDIVTSQSDALQRTVEFENKKKRGFVEDHVAYSYSLEKNLPYSQLLSTVEKVDPDRLLEIKHAAAVESDEVIIKAISNEISTGNVTKMLIAKEASLKAKVSRKSILSILEKYTGTDASLHRWNFNIRERGSHHYHLLVPPLDISLNQNQSPKSSNPRIYLTNLF